MSTENFLFEYEQLCRKHQKLIAQIDLTTDLIVVDADDRNRDIENTMRYLRANTKQEEFKRLTK